MWNTAVWDYYLMLMGKPVLESTDENVWKGICTFAGFKATVFSRVRLYNPQASLNARVHAFAFCTKAFVAAVALPVKSMQIIHRLSSSAIKNTNKMKIILV